MGKLLAGIAAAIVLLWLADPAWAFVALFSLVVLLAAFFLLIELANLLGRWDSSDPDKEMQPHDWRPEDRP